MRNIRSRSPQNKKQSFKAIETGITDHSRRHHDETDEAKWAIAGIIINNENPPSGDHGLKMANGSNGGYDLPDYFSFEAARSIGVNKWVDDISRFSLL